MRQNLSIVLLLFSTIVYGGNKVKKYYKYINLAEKNIINNNLADARRCYTKAFRLEAVYFGYDIRNAIRVEAELTPDSTSLFWCFNNYVKIGFRGYKEETGFKDSYPKFYNYPFWNSIEKILDTVKTTFNDELTSRLQAIYTLDQSTRLAYMPGQKNSISTDDELNRIDSTNVVSLLNLIENYTINETTIQSEQLFSTIGVILAHNRGQGEGNENVNKLFKVIKEEVLKGNYDARSYANNFDRRYSEAIKKEKPPRNGYYGTEVCFITKKFFIALLPSSKKTKKMINKRRKQIYLNDYVTAANKMKFQFKLSEDVFDVHYNFGLFYYAFPPNSGVEQKFLDKIKQSIDKYDIYFKEG